MQPSTDTPPVNKHKWVYATLRVRDGERIIKPNSVGSRALRFSKPPRLQSAQIEIILTNGNDIQRNMAEVLPHDPDATHIPIRVLPETCVNSTIHPRIDTNEQPDTGGV